MNEAKDNPTYFEIEAACRNAFENEGDYGHPESNAHKYRVFRDGFFAGWFAAKQPTDYIDKAIKAGVGSGA